MKKLIVSLLLCVLAPMSLAEPSAEKVETAAEKAKRCKVKDTGSLYYSVRLNEGETAGNIYEEKVSGILKWAKDHKISGFKILSQDVSVNQNCCGTSAVDVNVSLSFEYDPNYQVLTILNQKSGSANVSSSRYHPLDCD